MIVRSHDRVLPRVMEFDSIRGCNLQVMEFGSKRNKLEMKLYDVEFASSGI